MGLQWLDPGSNEITVSIANAALIPIYSPRYRVKYVDEDSRPDCGQEFT